MYVVIVRCDHVMNEWRNKEKDQYNFGSCSKKRERERREYEQRAQSKLVEGKISDVKVYDQFCNENIEYLILSMKPFYLPREFTKVFGTVVYI